MPRPRAQHEPASWCARGSMRIADLLAAISLGHFFGSPYPPWPHCRLARRHVVVHQSGDQRLVRGDHLDHRGRVDPGLVNINVVFGFSGGRGAATGTVLTPSGEVLTNNHVVFGTTKISVTDIGKARRIRRPSGVRPHQRRRGAGASGRRGLQTVPLGDSSTAAVRYASRPSATPEAPAARPRWRVADHRLAAGITAADPGAATLSG